MLERVLYVGGWGVILGVGVCVALAGVAGAVTALRYLEVWEARRHAVSGLRCSEQGKDTVSGVRASSSQAQECTGQHDAKRTRS